MTSALRLLQLTSSDVNGAVLIGHIWTPWQCRQCQPKAPQFSDKSNDMVLPINELGPDQSRVASRHGPSGRRFFFQEAGPVATQRPNHTPQVSCCDRGFLVVMTHSSMKLPRKNPAMLCRVHTPGTKGHEQRGRRLKSTAPFRVRGDSKRQMAKGRDVW